MDQYQIYILKQPDEGLAESRGQGVCGLVGADLENGRDSRCNSWTPCGLRKNMISVGGVFFGYNAGPGNVFEVDFAQIGLLLYRDNRYLVNVMRTPESDSGNLLGLCLNRCFGKIGKSNHAMVFRVVGVIQFVFGIVDDRVRASHGNR